MDTATDITHNEVLAHEDQFFKVSFQLHYTTHFGQQIFLYGNHPLLGYNKMDNAIPLVYVNKDYWETTIKFPIGDVKEKIIYMRLSDIRIKHIHNILRFFFK
jgi:hypothetical protein